jgi:hypothetical protein
LQWWVNVMLLGTFAPEKEYWPGAVFKNKVYAEYTHWCRAQNERYPIREFPCTDL